MKYPGLRMPGFLGTERESGFLLDPKNVTYGLPAQYGARCHGDNLDRTKLRPVGWFYPAVRYQLLQLHMKSTTRLVCVLAAALGFAASSAHASPLFVADFNDQSRLNIYDGGSLENGWSLTSNHGKLKVEYTAPGQAGGPDIFSPNISSGNFIAAVTVNGAAENYLVAGILAQIPGQFIPLSVGSDPSWGGNVWINFNHASTFVTVPKNTSVTLLFLGTRSAKGDTLSAYYDAGKGFVLAGSVDYVLGAGGTVQFALNTGLYGNTASVTQSSATYSDFWTLELPNW